CRGEIAGEDVAVIVNHWPSRGAKSDRREIAGRQVKRIKDSLLVENPDVKVIIMGDLNDDPMNVSIKEALGAKRKPEQCKAAADLYNPWWDILAGGNGTLKFRDQWNLFDQIIFTGNLLGTDRSTLKFYKAEIFSRDYLFEHEGKFKGYPKRTHGSGIWLNGYSDHLPTRIFLIKEVK
ncbi:MAG: endonuclease/exonuclease/phosphatase family protein, partial [Bacteroidaceae bacterium]|nr:endonuclease/exonuclease/phosphatase family protein [Bacteroidaceae bacterium]